MRLLILERRLHGDLIMAFQYLKWAYKKSGDNLLARPVVAGQGVMTLKQNKERFKLDG